MMNREINTLKISRTSGQSIGAPGTGTGTCDPLISGPGAGAGASSPRQKKSDKKSKPKKVKVKVKITPGQAITDKSMAETQEREDRKRFIIDSRTNKEVKSIYFVKKSKIKRNVKRMMWQYYRDRYRTKVDDVIVSFNRQKKEVFDMEIIYRGDPVIHHEARRDLRVPAIAQEPTDRGK
jgi:hypothetical protein